MQRIILILLLCCLTLFLKAQQFKFQNFSVTDGLAQSQVYAIEEDKNGYLWFGTQGGLSRFDGKIFDNYSTRDGLGDNSVFAILKAKNGNLLIGTNVGLTIYDGVSFQNLELEKGNSVPVFSIYEDENERVWLGTKRGIYTYENGVFLDYSKEKEMPKSEVRDFYKDSRGQLWVGGLFGVLQIFSDTEFKHYRYRRNELNINQVESIGEDHEGKIWVGTYSGGINIFENGTWSRILKGEPDLENGEGLSSNLVKKIFRDSTFGMWVGTQDNGITIINTRDSTFQYLTETKGLANNFITAIKKDSWGNIWIGTSGGGISRYYGEQFMHFDKTNGLKGNRVYAITQDTTGDIWMSSSDRGVTRYDGQDFYHYGTEDGFTEMRTKALLADSKGRIWLGTSKEGIAIYDSTGFHFYKASNGLSGNWIKSLTEDRLGNMWIGTTQGLTKATVFEQDSLGRKVDFKTYRRQDGLASNSIQDIHVDKIDRVWYATREGGIGYIQNDTTFVNLGRKEGLPDLNVVSILEDSEGLLWIGTANKGVYKMNIYVDSLVFERLDKNRELTSDILYLLALDKEENLYVGSEIGIDKITLDAEKNIKKLVHFGRTEGFEGVETCKNAVLMDNANNVWFGTMNGLMKYNPSEKDENLVPPKVSITEIRLFYEPLSETKYKDSLTREGTLKPSLKLPYFENNLGFEFIGINQSNPLKVRYQWKLEGLEKDWSPFSNNTNATYANLSPGDYTFLVRAENEDGVLSEIPKGTTFTILKPYWQELWFIATIIGGLLLLIALIFRNRLNIIRQRAKEEQARLEMENNLLQLEQKALQLQMNPHFIFNALASIQSLISKQDHKTARYYLAKFAKLMRSILENSRVSKISLEEEIETLENYLALERFSRGNSFEYEISKPQKFDAEEVEIPPMLLQPFVENAIVHGVSNLKRKGKISLSFDLKGKMLKCIIEDNGIGRKRAKERKIEAGNTHKSVALEVTRERLELMNEHREESLIVEDLEIGTRVLVYLSVF